MHFPSSNQLRIFWYRRRWTAQVEGPRPNLVSPTMFVGPGRVRLTGPVTFGWEQGPRFYDGYTYIEARSPTAIIQIGAGSHFNNAVTVVSEGAGITIGERCLIGPGCQIYDSDFHAKDPSRREDGSQLRAPVTFGDGVMLSSGSIVLKGVSIGSGTVISAGSVVTRDIPARVVAMGNPAQVVKEF